MALVVMTIRDNDEGTVDISTVSEPGLKAGTLTQAQALALTFGECAKAIGEKRAFHVSKRGRIAPVEEKT